MKPSKTALAILWMESEDGNLAGHPWFDDLVIDTETAAFAEALPASGIEHMRQELEARREMASTLERQYRDSFTADEPRESRRAIACDILVNRAGIAFAQQFLRRVDENY